MGPGKERPHLKMSCEKRTWCVPEMESKSVARKVLNQNHNKTSFYSRESAYNPKVDVIGVGKDGDKLAPSHTMIRMWTGYSSFG